MLLGVRRKLTPDADMSNAGHWFPWLPIPHRVNAKLMQLSSIVAGNRPFTVPMEWGARPWFCYSANRSKERADFFGKGCWLF
jgi:hypothetical protein